MQLNKRLEFLKESETLRLNAEAKRLQAQGLPVINLAAGELDFETQPYLRDALKHKLHYNKYTPTLGFLELRARLAKKIKRQYQWAVAPEQIAVTAGAKQALYELFQVLLNPGEEVLIPIPTWVSYETQVRLAGGKPVFVPLAADFDLDVTAIKAKLRAKTKAIVLNSPHNPTGKVFSKRALKELARLLRGREISVVYDDVYCRLIYTQARKGSSRLPFHPAHLAIVGSFSKSQALTGWRIGYLVADRRIVERMGRLQSHLTSNAAILSQYAAIEALKRKEPTASFLRVLKKRRTLVGRLLREIPRISFQDPDGAFYVWLDIRRLDQNSNRFCKRLLEKKNVMLIPGEVFHAPGFVRLSFVAPEGDLRRALRALKDFVIRHYQ